MPKLAKVLTNPYNIIFNPPEITTSNIMYKGDVLELSDFEVKKLDFTLRNNLHIKLATGKAVKLSGHTLNFNGHTLTIEGDLIHSGGTLNMNGGKLIVKGDYRIQTPSTAGKYTHSTGILTMVNPEDYIVVNGDFVMDSYYRHDGNLSAGILDIKGNFTQKSTTSGRSAYYNFYTTKTHKVILSGIKKQTVNFDDPAASGSHFRILESRNAKGINFKTPITSSLLFNHQQKPFILADSKQSYFSDFDGDKLKDNIDPYPLDKSPLNAAKFYAMTPMLVEQNKTTNFIISGIALPSTIIASIEGETSPCIKHFFTATEVQFHCTATTLGKKRFTIKTTQGGELLSGAETLQIEVEKMECKEVATDAYNPKTGEEKQYTTPCDVPIGWIIGIAPDYDKDGKNDIVDLDDDNDGLPDVWEKQYGLNPFNANDARQDKDKDGLSNLDEYKYKTDPTNPDTDGDGRSDGDEVKAGTDPRVKDKPKNNAAAIIPIINFLLADDNKAVTLERITLNPRNIELAIGEKIALERKVAGFGSSKELIDISEFGLQGLKATAIFSDGSIKDLPTDDLYQDIQITDNSIIEGKGITAQHTASGFARKMFVIHALKTGSSTLKVKFNGVTSNPVAFSIKTNDTTAPIIVIKGDNPTRIQQGGGIYR